jgi:hypothetical protein
MSDFRYYELHHDNLIGMFADLDDLADWLGLFEEREGAQVTTEEIATADGDLFEVVMCDGAPVGVADRPATAALLAALAPLRTSYAIAAE